MDTPEVKQAKKNLRKASAAFQKAILAGDSSNYAQLRREYEAAKERLSSLTWQDWQKTND